MTIRSIAATAAVALLAGSAMPAAAASITTLYSTGVNAVGVATIGNGADLHWTLNGGSAFTGGTNGVFPIPPWVSETATSRWLTPSTNAADGFYDASTDGIYTYTQVFSLTGYKASTASFSGVFASDNTVDKITLNGVTIAGSGGSFSSWNAFSSAGGTFNAGVNTLTFTVRNFAQNGGNPTGLNVDVVGSATAVPEPASWALMVVGFGMVGFATRRRSAAIAA